MDIKALYNYLARARRDLWSALENCQDSSLSAPLLNGERFRCIKDLLFHIPSVEDSWIHEDILRVEPLWTQYPEFIAAGQANDFSGIHLNHLLEYWKVIELNTQDFLAGLDENGMKRIIVPHDDEVLHYPLENLLWHIGLHEIRHTAQVCLLLRLQGIKPPSLDLLFYL